MTEGYKKMLALVASAARGDTFNGDPGEYIDAKEVYAASVFARCEYLYALGMQDIASRVGDSVSKDFLNFLKTRIYSEATLSAYIGSVILELQNSGIRPVILKGRALAELYALPEARTSCDTDILIDPEDEEKAYRVLRECGFTVSNRSSYSNQALCTHPDAGIIELHVSLFFDHVKHVVMSDIAPEQFMKDARGSVRIGNVRCDTLGITDHFIFVFLHSLQHFLREGASVRQFLDILLYLRSNKSKMDMKRVYEMLDAFGARGYYNGILSLGVDYMGFEEKDLPDFERLDRVVSEKLGNDTETGGWLGKSRDDDGSVFRYYGSVKDGDKGKDHKKYLKRYQRNRIFTSVFPNRKRMEAKIPMAKHALLLPVAWVLWLIYGLKLSSKGILSTSIKDENKLLDTEKERVELFGQLGLI